QLSSSVAQLCTSVAQLNSSGAYLHSSVAQFSSSDAYLRSSDADLSFADHDLNSSDPDLSCPDHDLDSSHGHRTRRTLPGRCVSGSSRPVFPALMRCRLHSSDRSGGPISSLPLPLCP